MAGMDLTGRRSNRGISVFWMILAMGGRGLRAAGDPARRYQPGRGAGGAWRWRDDHRQRGRDPGQRRGQHRGRRQRQRRHLHRRHADRRRPAAGRRHGQRGSERRSGARRSGRGRGGRSRRARAPTPTSTGARTRPRRRPTARRTFPARARSWWTPTAPSLRSCPPPRAPRAATTRRSRTEAAGPTRGPAGVASGGAPPSHPWRLCHAGPTPISSAEARAGRAAIAGAGRRALERRDDMNLEQFTERSRGFVQAAQTIAMREEHQRLVPEHLLKALMDDEEGFAANLIARAGGDAKRVREAVDAAVARLPKVSGDAQTYLDGQTAKVLDQAQQLAKKGRRQLRHRRAAADGARHVTRSKAKEALDAGGLNAQGLKPRDRGHPQGTHRRFGLGRGGLRGAQRSTRATSPRPPARAGSTPSSGATRRSGARCRSFRAAPRTTPS